ncbi:MAG: hypothetical protein ACREB3_06570 [Burkholderiales bacterium]
MNGDLAFAGVSEMPYPGGILALDIASKSGWCYGVPPRDAPSSPLLLYRAVSVSGSIGAKCSQLFDFLDRLVTRTGPRAILFEAPLSRNFHTARITFSLCGIAEMVAHRRHVPICKEAKPLTVRKHFVGKCRRGDDGKRDTIERCNALGFETSDSDEADAIALWHYAREFMP